MLVCRHFVSYDNIFHLRFGLIGLPSRFIYQPLWDVGCDKDIFFGGQSSIPDRADLPEFDCFFPPVRLRQDRGRRYMRLCSGERTANESHPAPRTMNQPFAVVSSAIEMTLVGLIVFDAPVSNVFLRLLSNQIENISRLIIVSPLPGQIAF
jgi:hypothetical protein